MYLLSKTASIVKLLFITTVLLQGCTTVWKKQPCKTPAECAEKTASIAGEMQENILSNWSEPEGANRGLEVMIQTELDRNGRVLRMSVIESSGNMQFDKSAMNAIKRVGQFEEVKYVNDTTYSRNFKKLRFIFRPEAI
ncbi:energy transducer TonB [Spartinivicinus poritis]|uniref:Energy transducer TonB n=1 Tax=Spartinivicinus poritis TaxID=2994640 RepID=A0ABT5UEY6_9GAMM|nr:energy transducer TonB [Spartinivicinus sp. A2-2]MDE1464945.1 energy transducer TonB [Spartinivicinus sp. A2-2]